MTRCSIGKPRCSAWRARCSARTARCSTRKARSRGRQSGFCTGAKDDYLSCARSGQPPKLPRSWDTRAGSPPKSLNQMIVNGPARRTAVVSSESAYTTRRSPGARQPRHSSQSAAGKQACSCHARHARVALILKVNCRSAQPPHHSYVQADSPWSPPPHPRRRTAPLRDAPGARSGRSIARESSGQGAPKLPRGVRLRPSLWGSGAAQPGRPPAGRKPRGGG